MSYRFLDHATDAIVEVEAEDIEGAFVAAANATVELTLDQGSVNEVDAVEFSAEGENLFHLLFSWLEEIIFILITRGFAIKRVEIEAYEPSAGKDGGSERNAGRKKMCAKAYGEPIDLHRHGFKVEIKAPTFHDMRIRDGGRPVVMRFLLDL